MISKIKGWLLDKQTHKLKERKNSILAELNDELRETKKEYADALKEAQQMQKIIESRRRIEALKSQTKQLEDQFDDNDDDDNDDYDDEDDDDNDDFADKLAKDVFGNLAKKFTQGSQPSPQGLALQNASPVRAKAGQALQKLTDEQLDALDKKGFFD